MKISALALWAVLVVPLSSVGLSAQEETRFAAPPPLECTGYKNVLFLAQGNVVLSNLRWRIPGTGEIGCGQALPNREDTGHFWFFGRENIELTCKAINGLVLNQKFWIFCGGLTNVEWWVEARNNANPELPGKSYYNPPGQMASFADVNAFGHGANNSPYFVLARTECGREQVLPAGAGTFLIQVRDPDGDPLVAQVKVLEGNGAAVEIDPLWQGPIEGSEQGKYLWFDVKVPKTPGSYVLALEVADGRSLLPAQCIVTLRVP